MLSAPSIDISKLCIKMQYIYMCIYVYVFYDRWLKASAWLGIPLWMEVFSLVKIICKNRKPIGEVGCCESGMAKRIHWWIERCLISLTLSLSFSAYLPTYLLTYLPTYLSSIYLSIYRSLYLSLSLSSNYLSSYLSIYLSISLSISLSIYLSIYLSLSLSIYLPTYLSIYLSIYLSLSIYLPTYLSIYLSLSFYLSIYLSISRSIVVVVVVVVVGVVVAVAFVVEVRVVKSVKLVQLISVYFFDIFTSKKPQNPQFFTLLTSKCASRHNGVHFFDTFSTSELQKVVRDRQFLTLLTWKCASRHNGVHFFDIATSKSGPTMVCFVHFDLETCFAPQRRALFRHQLPKVVRSWGVLYILTWKCASRHNGVHFFDISSSKSGPYPWCFVHFDLEMCFAPQRRAIFHRSCGQLAPHPPL